MIYNHYSEYSEYVDIHVYSWDTKSNRWYGKGVEELINNQHNTMTGEQIEQAVEKVNHIPALQSIVAKLESKVGAIKDISDYVECEVCGSLVRKGMAQVFSSVELKNNLLCFNLSIGFYPSKDAERESVLHYVCNHCDAKKYEKELKKSS